MDTAWKQWERIFKERLRAEGTAERAWSKIEKASNESGLDLDWVVALFLFKAAKMHDSVSAEIRRGLSNQVHALKAARLADRVAKKRSRHPKAQRFALRRMEALQIAAKTSWAFRNPNVKTLHDAASRYPEIGAETLEQAPHSVAKGAETIRRWGPRKLMLAAIRAGARAHGVNLTPSALAALANCADPDWEINERTLRRFFREPMLKLVEQSYVAEFESLLNEIRRNH